LVVFLKSKTCDCFHNSGYVYALIGTKIALLLGQ